MPSHLETAQGKAHSINFFKKRKKWKILRPTKFPWGSPIISQSLEIRINQNGKKYNSNMKSASRQQRAPTITVQVAALAALLSPIPLLWIPLPWGTFFPTAFPWSIPFFPRKILSFFLDFFFPICFGKFEALFLLGT